PSYAPSAAPAIFMGGAGVFGMVIGRDATFPAPARAWPARGATALFVPTNNALAPAKGGAEVVEDARRTDVRRAMEGGVSVIRADVAGRVDGLESYGSSAIVDHDGTVLTVAKQLEPDLLIAELPIAAVDPGHNRYKPGR
ncbi:MAG: nitrilase-related carbon-nitrogen hydrolase, partial [Acidobacteriota bacterium]